MHARSTGPYSLITQQPLGGKAQHGGPATGRNGSLGLWKPMEQPNLLEEMLYFKSDDVDGRNNAFKAITRVEKSHHLPVCLNPSMCCSASLNP